MANNAYVNKVVINDQTLIDLTRDTVSEEKLLSGETAHDASGKPIVGTFSPGPSDVPTPYFQYNCETGTDSRSSGYQITKSGTIENTLTGAYFLTTAYATIPSTFDTSFTEWTIRVAATITSKSTCTYMRICRANTDALSIYQAYSSGKYGIKLTNKTISSDDDDIQWYDTTSRFEHSARSKNFSYVPTKTTREANGRIDIVFVKRSDGYVYLYLNGVKACRQKYSMIGSFTNFGVGDTGGNTYYAAVLRIDAFEIYNVALTDFNIVDLHTHTKENVLVEEKTASDITVSGATVTVPKGYYQGDTSKSVASGSVSLNAPILDEYTGIVTSTATFSAGYISSTPPPNTLTIPTQGAQTITPTKSAQTISSRKYLTGTQTIAAIPAKYVDTSDANATAGNIQKGKTAYVNGAKLTGTLMNQQCYIGTAQVKATSYTATEVKLTVAVSGTYKVSWTGIRQSNSGTNGSQLYIAGSAYGSAQTTFTSTYYQRVELSNVSLTAGREIVVRARSRSTSYYMEVGNLAITQTA